MTLIAFHAQQHRADIVTDTRTYAHCARRLHRTSKVMTLPHLDAAVICQGSTGFASHWNTQARHLAAQTPTFDHLLEATESATIRTWNDLVDDVDAANEAFGAEGAIAPSVAFLVGLTSRGFQAWQFASDNEFTPVQLTGLHVMPTPLDRRPSDLEAGRLLTHFHAAFGDAAPIRHLMRQPAPAPPQTRAGWVDLALAVRRDRALCDLSSGFKTYVGGDVRHTILTPGAVSDARIHAFDDTGAEFEQMVAGSYHPIAQAAPCQCGSGTAYVDCCLAPLADQPCSCGSGQVFADCCRVDVTQAGNVSQDDPYALESTHL